MKSVVDKNGKFLFTFEGGDVDLSDYEDCSIVDGDAPLLEFQAQVKSEADARLVEIEAERDEEHKHLHSLEDRSAHLESLING